MPAQPVTRLTLPCLATSTRFQQHPDKSACWIWTGRVDDGIPLAYYDGQARNARKGTWELMRGDRLSRTVRLNPTCGRNLCVNPNHMEHVVFTQTLPEEPE